MRLKFSLILSGIFFILGLVTLPHYGINWDSINHLPRGQSYLHYFLTGSSDFNDLPPWRPYWQKPESLWIDADIPQENVPRRSMYTLSADFNYFMEHDGDGHPPLSDILSSLANELLFVRLRLVNDIDSYRIYGLFLAAALVGLVFWWGAKVYGKFAGFVGALLVALYPLFWSHSHFNTEKDIPEIVFWSFMLFSVWRGITLRSIKWILASGIFFGLALGTKFNILFIGLVIIPWLTVYLTQGSISRRISLKLVLASFVAPFVGVAIFIGTWPFLWQDPLSGIAKVISFYKGAGIRNDGSSPWLPGPFNTDFYAVAWTTYITPPVILLLFLVGILTIIKKIKIEKDKVSLLFLLWFLIPVLRAVWPGVFIHGGVRHIMEYIPAMALIAGLGASQIVNLIQRLNIKYQNYISKFKIVQIFFLNFKLYFCILIFAFLIYPIVRLHPNESLYFNPLIGGLSGAKAQEFPNWGETYGEPYRQGVVWINKNAPSGAKLVFAHELMPNIPRIFLRKDFDFSNTKRSGYLREGEYAITLISQGVENRSYYDMYLERFIEPVYEVAVDGVSILKVWKNDQDHLKFALVEEEDTNFLLTPQESGLLIDLGEVRKLSRLEIDYDEFNCKPLSFGIVQISQGQSQKWESMPGALPDQWRIASIGEQPKGGRFIEPFVGQDARFINLNLNPVDTCLKNFTKVRVYFFRL